MNIKKCILTGSCAVFLFYACNDDGGGSIAPPRDFQEQQTNEGPKIEEYLRTHFITRIDNETHPDYQQVVFDTIAGANSDKTSIMEDTRLTTKEITRNDVVYTLYVLKLNEGSGGLSDPDNPTDFKDSPTFADEALVTYKGELFYDNQDEDGDGIPDDADIDENEDSTDANNNGIIDEAEAANNEGNDIDEDGILDEFDPVNNNDPNRKVFGSAVTPVWIDPFNVNITEGWRESLVDFKGTADFTVDPNTGNVSYTGFGELVVFIPSGLAYFNEVRTGVPVYSPLIFTIQLYAARELDHDGDGIPSYQEDIDGDRLLRLGLNPDPDDNTDGDAFPNYLDTDDDGDDVLTIDEKPGDDDNDGIPNYLDPDTAISING